MQIIIPEEMFQRRMTERELQHEVIMILVANYMITLQDASRLLRVAEADLLQWLTDRRISTRYNADAVQEAINAMRRIGR